MTDPPALSAGTSQALANRCFALLNQFAGRRRILGRVDNGQIAATASKALDVAERGGPDPAPAIADWRGPDAPFPAGCRKGLARATPSLMNIPALDIAQMISEQSWTSDAE